MLSFKKLILTTITLLTTIVVTIKPVYADEQFETSYDVTYTVEPTGETFVEQQVTIKNKMSDLLATSYSHTINQINIYEVTGQDRLGALDIEIETKDDKTTVKADLNEQVIGKDITLKPAGEKWPDPE